MSSEQDFARRALAAFYRTGSASVPAHAGLYTHDNRRYVQVWNDSGHTLAVYRIENCDRLKRLKRWPESASPLPLMHTSAGPIVVDHDANRRGLARTIQNTRAAFGATQQPETYMLAGGDIPAGSDVGFISEEEDRERDAD